MIGFRENPAARHALRLGRRSGRPWLGAAVLLGAAALGAVVIRSVLELESYAPARTGSLARWIALAILAEAALAPAWAAYRGAVLRGAWEREGLAEEYRRTRLGPAATAGGLLLAAVLPVAATLALSCLLAIGGLGSREAGGVLAAHLLLASEVLAFGAAGLAAGHRLRHPGAAIPGAWAALAAAACLVWALNPFYGRLPSREAWIYAALLPNPFTAVGSALGMDVLRFSWVYERVHATEYFYVYPPSWQTLGLYAGAACALLAGWTRQTIRSG